MKEYKEIEKHLNQKNGGKALKLIRDLLQFPKEIEDAAELKTVLDLLTKSFGQTSNDQLQQACQILSKDIANMDAFYKLGFILTARQYPEIASAVLAYAVKQAPNNLPVLHELVAALEMQGLYAPALSSLKNANGTDFTTRYLLAFNTLMTGDIDEALNIGKTLKSDSASSDVMLKKWHAIFARVRAVEGVTSLDRSDYRGWHFILTGGLLLHLPDPAKHMYGQYESLEDSESLIKEGIYRLCSIFDLWKFKVPKILSFDNPESHRLGLAFSSTLGIPEKTVVSPKEAGLFVVYDHSNVINEVMDGISKHSNSMLFYCHASQFNREYKVAPDFTNLMYTWLVSPWERHTIFPHRPDLPTSPPTENDQELAKRIVSAEIDKNNLIDLTSLLNLAEAGKKYAAFSQANGSSRERQWYGRKI